MNKRRICFLLTFTVLAALLCGCTSKEKSIKDSFIAFFPDRFNSNIFFTPNNTEMSVLTLDKEDSERNPRVVLSLHLGESDKSTESKYQWLQLPYEERKADLRTCADMVIDYAKAENWKNDYYLYVTVDMYDTCSIVYDYEKDKLWVPNCEETFVKMYEQFGTFWKDDLVELDGGVDFLVDNRLATIKHKEVDFNLLFSYTVYIHDGEFNSYGEDDSTCH